MDGVAIDQPTRTTRRAAANREAIVEAAEALLVEGGERAVTIEAIAARADVAIQTVYNRVGTRSAVLIAVAQRALEENRQFMDAAYAAPGSPIERVRRAGDAYARFAAQRPHQFRILVHPPNEPEALARVVELTREQNAKLAQALRDGVADGSFRADLDPELTADALWAALDGLLALAWRADDLRADADRLAQLRRAFNLILQQGLAANARRPSALAERAPHLRVEQQRGEARDHGGRQHGEVVARHLHRAGGGQAAGDHGDRGGARDAHRLLTEDRGLAGTGTLGHEPGVLAPQLLELDHREHHARGSEQQARPGEAHASDDHRGREEAHDRVAAGLHEARALLRHPRLATS